MASKVIAEYNDIKAVADAIRIKKQITDGILLKDMPSNVLSIGGADTSDATATADDITIGTTAYTSTGLTNGVNTYKKLETDAEVESQAELIQQIATALEGKASDSESKVETYTGTITYIANTSPWDGTCDLDYTNADMEIDYIQLGIDIAVGESTTITVAKNTFIYCAASLESMDKCSERYPYVYIPGEDGFNISFTIT